MPSAALQPLAYRPLPLGQIRPLGWLARQLRIQADGLSGHLNEFWPDVKDSRWFGGQAEGWERAPYWLDGFVPLAYCLNDPALIARANRYVDYIITHQDEDGWLGPREMAGAGGSNVTPQYDAWALMLALKVLVQYADASGDPRVPQTVARCLRRIDRHIERQPLFNWGQFRWFETLLAIYWLYEREPAPWLLDLAVKLSAQGFAWREFFARWPLTQPTVQGRWSYAGHVVNNAMAIKAPGLWWRLSGDPADRRAPHEMMALLDRYHGMVTGIFSGDECLAGRRPTQGTELCAVVEYAFSLEVLLSTLGDPAYGDRLEKIVFNALPATFSPDMWAHQYDQQTNQIECSVQAQPIWTTNGREANLFGLEPNYGCCTANLSQGWPKFAAHLWMQAPDDGLVVMAYAPCRVETTVHDVPVSIVLETGYPFRDTLHFRVSTARPVTFPLSLRIPHWAQGSSVKIEAEPAVAAEAGSFWRTERTWQGVTDLELTLPMAAALVDGYSAGSVAVTRGPLVYALPIGERWQRVNADRPYRELPHADWEVYPTSPWNYALRLGPCTLDHDLTFAEQPIGETPFSPQSAPVTAAVTGRRVPEWTSEHGIAQDVPAGPLHAEGPDERLKLIPYGCTNLRVTEFPVLNATDRDR